MSKLDHTQNAWLLAYLKEDRGWHTGDEIRQRSRLALGKQISLHPRITDLREEGVIIEHGRQGRDHVFRYAGEGMPPTKNENNKADPKAVQAYIFAHIDSDNPRNDTVCKIIGRAPASDSDLLTYGPAFTIEFGDGEIDTAFSTELHPWYPT